MTDGPTRRGFANRPGDPERWIKSAGRTQTKPENYTARLTIDITPDLRARIKIAAFQRGVTVADMLRELLAHEFPHTDGEQP